MFSCRIAIIKEGRLRAIGSSRFLKKRFGMGYLMRASMSGNFSKDPVREKIKEYIPDASVISDAGTELAIRLPRDSARTFPSLFGELDSSKDGLGIISYGIETTSLEEVFMRIVNEDTSAQLANPHEANQLLGGSPEERDKQAAIQRALDEDRYPLSDEMVKLLLQSGRNVGTDESDILTKQIKILFWKRFCQFVRSKGQWAMGAFVPLAMIVICGLIINDIPTEIVYKSSPTDLSYQSIYTTPVSGYDEASTAAWAQSIGIPDVTYVGKNYSDLYTYLQYQTSGGGNLTTGAAAFFSSSNNATILYNASYPIWYPGLISGVLQSAVNDATGGLLQLKTTCLPLEAQALDEQV
jgi:hypothetical protein